VQLIGELDNCLGSTIAYESAKLLRELNDVDLVKARGLIAGISHIQIMVLKKISFLFNLRLSDVICWIVMMCLLVNKVDDTLMRLVDSLESWNAFPWGEHIWMHLYDEIMNVVCNHKNEHLEGLHKSYNYVPTYTLSSFVWAFKESNPIFDLRPTLAEYKPEWWTSTIDFLQVYIPRTPIRKHDLLDAYLQKVSAGRERNRLCRHISTMITNVRRSKISSLKDFVIKELNSCIFKLEAIIHVLGLERKGGVVEKLKFGDEFCHLSGDFCDELNHDFLELFESAICNSVGTQLDADTEDVFDELEEEERLLLEEDIPIEEEKMVRLEEQKRLVIKEEMALEVKKSWGKDYRKRSYAFMNSDHMKQAMAWCAPKKRMLYVTVRTASWLQVCSKFKKKKESFGLVDPDMTEFLKNVKPWVEGRLPEVLDLVNVFDKKGIDNSTYHVTFRIAENVPKQGVFGDYGASLAYHGRMT
nr:hypothetical protein [Tanacetum cinerariifolium]